MKLAKPQWNLAIHILPPVFSSLALVMFFPEHLFLFLIGMVIFSVILGSWLGIKNLFIDVADTKINTPQDDTKDKGIFKWLFILLGLIVLLGISSMFFVFLTAANQLSPEQLVFGEVARIWRMTFPIGICLLITQIIMAFISQKEIIYRQHNFLKKKKNTSIHQLLYGKNPETIEKVLMSNQMFLKLGGFSVLVISLSIVILNIANGLARWLGFEVPIGFQFQTMITSTLIYLPFTTKRWRKRRFLKSKRSRVFGLFNLTMGLILFIVLLIFLTLPWASPPIPVKFLSYDLTLFQWELFILGWWIGITPLIASQIIHLSTKKSLAWILIALIILSGGVYGVLLEFLVHGGEDYFLVVIREGILALILTALPVGGLILNVLPFQDIAELKSTHLDQRKQFRNQEHLTHSLMQATAITCALYCVSGLSILFVLLLGTTIPWLMRFLLTEMVYIAHHRCKFTSFSEEEEQSL